MDPLDGTQTRPVQYSFPLKTGHRLDANGRIPFRFRQRLNKWPLIEVLSDGRRSFTIPFVVLWHAIHARQSSPHRRLQKKTVYVTSNVLQTKPMLLRIVDGFFEPHLLRGQRERSENVVCYSFSLQQKPHSTGTSRWLFLPPRA